MKFQYEANKYVVSLLEKGDMIDLASGKKELIGIMKERGIDAISLDINREAQPDIVHDLNKPLPLKTNSFNQVTCVDSLEHIENVSNVFEEVHRILKPKGVFIVTFPNTKFYRKTKHRHTFYFTYKKVKKLINSRLFRVEKEIYFYYIPYMGKTIRVPFPFLASHFVFKLRKMVIEK